MKVQLWPAKHARILQCRRGLHNVYRETVVKPGSTVVEFTPLANSTIELVDNGEVVGEFELQFNSPSTVRLEPVSGYVFDNEIKDEVKDTVPLLATGESVISKSKVEEAAESLEAAIEELEDKPDEDDMEDDIEQDLEEELDEQDA